MEVNELLSMNWKDWMLSTTGYYVDKAINAISPQCFQKSPLASRTMTVETIAYYFKNFHLPVFEELSPASSSATAASYYYLIQLITDPRPSANSKSDYTTLRGNIGGSNKRFNNLMKLNVYNRNHLMNIMKTLGELLKDNDTFSVELHKRHKIYELGEECNRIATAVEFNITYLQACDPKLCRQLRIQQKHRRK